MRGVDGEAGADFFFFPPSSSPVVTRGEVRSTGALSLAQCFEFDRISGTGICTAPLSHTSAKRGWQMPNVVKTSDKSRKSVCCFGVLHGVEVLQRELPLLLLWAKTRLTFHDSQKNTTCYKLFFLYVA